jgi:hypothetical protein
MLDQQCGENSDCRRLISEQSFIRLRKIHYQSSRLRCWMVRMELKGSFDAFRAPP